MKKYVGHYTQSAAKALKSSRRIVCRVTDDGTIYVCNGFFAYKMSAEEYAEIVQPITQHEAGNWCYILESGLLEAPPSGDFVKVFFDTVKDNENGASLHGCPLLFQRDKVLLNSFYDPEKQHVSFFNSFYLSAFVPRFTLRSTKTVAAGVVYDDGEPFAIVMPVRPDEKDTAAVTAYFGAQSDEITTKKELREAQEEADTLRAQIATLQEALAAVTEQAKAQTTADVPAADTKSAAEIIASRFADFPGVTVTVKGAQTAAPVVWLTGDTDPPRRRPQSRRRQVEPQTRRVLCQCRVTKHQPDTLAGRTVQSDPTP